MGIGPHKSSLAERVKLPAPVWSNPFAMQLEGIARKEARRERAIYLSTKNRAPRKAEAPAKPLPKQKGQERLWEWVGESIDSKQMFHGCTYTAQQLRKAGFKLAKIKGGKEKCGN